MKTARKVIFIILGSLAVLVIGLTISAFLFKDRIIQEFIREANKSLNTPVRIGKIDVSIWNDFPNMSIVCKDVYIEDSQPGEYPLLTAATIAFSINPIEAYSGNYAIRGLQVEDSKTSLKINTAGKNNFTILKKTANSGSSVSFDLKNVILKQTHVEYHDSQSHFHHIFDSDDIDASIGVRANVYKIDAVGDVLINQIGLGEKIFFKGKKFDVDATLDYDDLKKNVLIDTSSLKLNRSLFTIAGSYSFQEKNLIDIVVDGKDTDIQTLFSLLPENENNSLNRYQSDGDVYFNMKLKGEISARKSPGITASFGCTNTKLFHPDYKSTIEHATFEGSFASPAVLELSEGQLFLSNISGELNGRPFSSNLSIQDLNDPYVSFDFKGNMDAASIQNFYPIDKIKNLKGEINADFSFDGQLGLLKNKSTAQKVHTSGSIEMVHLNLQYGSQEINIRDLNGSFQFNNNDLALSNVTGYFEKSDFLLNGFFKNIITFLLFEDQPIGIEADLKSDFIDLDQLFEIGYGKDNSSDYSFSISPNLHLNFNGTIKSMKYRRFAPKNIKGDILVKNQMAVSRNIKFDALGGTINLNGIVDAKNTQAIDVVSSFTLDGVNIDSIFFVFENFKQTFIEDHHLKGKSFADVNLDMTLNEKLKLLPETLISDINVTIKNGELNNFDPLRSLNKYLDDESLSHLRFGDLKNNIHIENQTIFIPQMEINSNATSIQLSGTHTFDQKIDYRIVSPLRNKKKIDPDEAFGAIEDDGTGKLKVFLKIIGTTSNYTVSYDKEAVKKKIASNIKKEVQELKDAFKQKGKKKEKELELEKDDYFDWTPEQK